MRKLPALMALALLSIVLVACGSTNDKKTPTPAEERAQSTTVTSVTSKPTVASARGERTIVTVTDEQVASPAATAGASPIASPIASPVGSPVASPVSESTVTLQGVVELPGTANEDFLLSDDGCVGLGQYAGLSVGQQVVVRDQAGTIVGVTQLNGGGDRVSCAWSFEVEVPSGTFYEVTLPMMGDRVFSADEVTAGPVTLTLP